MRSESQLMALETEWYRQFGRYPERLVKDNMGKTYPVGDWSWNRKHPHEPEIIEPRMNHELGLTP